MAGHYGRFHEFVGWTLHADDPIYFAQAGDMASALAMQLWRGLAEFAHLSRCQNAARKAWSCSEQFRQRVQGGGTRVVTVVDHCETFCELHHFAALVRRLQMREYALRIFRADAPNACGCQRGYGVHHVVAADQRQLEARSA